MKPNGRCHHCDAKLLRNLRTALFCSYRCKWLSEV